MSPKSSTTCINFYGNVKFLPSEIQSRGPTSVSASPVTLDFPQFSYLDYTYEVGRGGKIFVSKIPFEWTDEEL